MSIPERLDERRGYGAIPISLFWDMCWPRAKERFTVLDKVLSSTSFAEASRQSYDEYLARFRGKNGFPNVCMNQYGAIIIASHADEFHCAVLRAWLKLPVLNNEP